MKALTDEQIRNSFFKKHVDTSGFLYQGFIPLLILGLINLNIFIPVLGIFSDDRQLLVAELLVVMVFLIFIVSYVNLLVDKQRLALMQCLTVAEVYGFPLNVVGIESLKSKNGVSSPDRVFENFVEYLEKNHPQVIPQYFFEASGKTGETCRKLVEFLWKRRAKTQVVEESSDESLNLLPSRPAVANS